MRQETRDERSHDLEYYCARTKVGDAPSSPALLHQSRTSQEQWEEQQAFDVDISKERLNRCIDEVENPPARTSSTIAPTPEHRSPSTMPTYHTRTQPTATSNSAPLPSPSSQPSQWLYPQAQARNPPPTSQPQSTSQQPQGHTQGVNDDTSISKQDFCLIAEAAKRAQMAVLMRDLGEVTL
ncbi:MAG: hypothetical protein Q9173_003300 [Seirophora scorigena]